MNNHHCSMCGTQTPKVYNVLNVNVVGYEILTCHNCYQRLKTTAMREYDLTHTAESKIKILLGVQQ